VRGGHAKPPGSPEERHRHGAYRLTPDWRIEYDVGIATRTREVSMSSPSADPWVTRYAASHQHPINRACHTIGIPLIVVSLVMLAVSPWIAALWKLAAAVFVTGWIFQFVGHYFEGKPPEFFHDWRFLVVGLRWWVAKMRGRA
jgi:hypothetical protein